MTTDRKSTAKPLGTSYWKVLFKLALTFVSDVYIRKKSKYEKGSCFRRLTLERREMIVHNGFLRT